MTLQHTRRIGLGPSVVQRECRFGALLAALLTALSATGTAAASSTAILYAQDFESGRGGFTTSGLWDRVNSATCLGRPGFAMYYGDDDCNYETGGINSGVATSPAIDLTSAVGPVSFTFEYILETERSGFLCIDDVVQVRASTDGFATSTLLADQGCGAPTALADPSSGWQSASIDLSAFAGTSVQLRFSFDSVDSSFNGFLGWGIDTLLITAFGDDVLSLEAPPCPDDADPAPGQQVAVELWMRNPSQLVTGFQAFVLYDTGSLTFRADLSAYTAIPFPEHIISIGSAEGPAGRLTLAGSDVLGGGGTGASSLLAILVFDVLNDCAITEIEFDLAGLFDSELSFQGVPIPTKLSSTGPISLDDAAPVFTFCPPDLVSPAYAETPLCAISDCCTATLLTGCSNATCTAIVCASDAFCCDSAWDAICALEAQLWCPAEFGPCAGALVSFPPATATDDCGGPVAITCSHASGSFFPVGVTSVTCTATDECGNVSVCQFDIEVTPTNLVDVTVELVGSEPTSRCIHFVADACSATADEVLAFTGPPGGPAVGMGTIEIPCGDWTTLCAKDSQHTKWHTVGVIPAFDRWVTVSTLTLLPGDTDNDGDVDINDVTWLVATFGNLAAAGGCPFATSTPRDADFSNNGAVLSEDYSLLSGQFLSASSCTCAMAAEPGSAAGFDQRRSLPTLSLAAHLRHADLNGDLVFDWIDVEEFERRAGLPHSLSTRMRNGR